MTTPENWKSGGTNDHDWNYGGSSGTTPPTDAIRACIYQMKESFDIDTTPIATEAETQLQALLDALKTKDTQIAEQDKQIGWALRHIKEKDARIAELEAVNPMRAEII